MHPWSWKAVPTEQRMKAPMTQVAELTRRELMTRVEQMEQLMKQERWGPQKVRLRKGSAGVRSKQGQN